MIDEIGVCAIAQRQYDVATNSPSGAASRGFSEIVVEAAGAAIGTSIVRVTVDDGNATTAAGTSTGSMGGKTEIIKALETVIQYIRVQPYPDA